MRLLPREIPPQNARWIKVVPVRRRIPGNWAVPWHRLQSTATLLQHPTSSPICWLVQKKVTFYHRNSGRIPEIGIKWTPLNLRIMTVKCALPEMHSNSVQLDGQLSTKKSIPVTCVPQIALLAPLWSYPPHGGVLSGNSLFRPDCVTVSQALRYRHFLINSGGTSDSTEIVNLIAIFSRI